MPYKLISPTNYQEFLFSLTRLQESVKVPLWKEGKTVFGSLSPGSPQVEPNKYIPTLLPLKKYLYPNNETLFNFSQGQIKQNKEKEARNKPLIVAGVRPCDINALRQMDKLFLGDVVDPYYKARREQLIILGWDCTQHCDEHCFCESVGSLSVNEGYDLFFSPLGGDSEDYVISIGSSTGSDLLVRHAQTNEISDDIMAAYQYHQADKLRNFPKRLKENIGSVPLLFVGSYESPHWKELEDLCFGCGACNIVCPTCSCFDVRDEVNIDMENGKRYRCWDGCMLQDFALVAGGHNFRSKRSARVRHRMYRKFKYQMQRYREPFCTGCGRCIRSCLANINPFEIINRLFDLNLERRQSKTSRLTQR